MSINDFKFALFKVFIFSKILKIFEKKLSVLRQLSFVEQSNMSERGQNSWSRNVRSNGSRIQVVRVNLLPPIIWGADNTIDNDNTGINNNERFADDIEEVVVGEEIVEGEILEEEGIAEEIVQEEIVEEAIIPNQIPIEHDEGDDDIVRIGTAAEFYHSLTMAPRRPLNIFQIFQEWNELEESRRIDDINRRKKTFKHWPKHQISQKIDVLVEAGFFYRGRGKKKH